MIRNRVLVSGLVQGVFFGETCRRVAAARGVAGWVRNLPDGRVEAVFEGPETAVRDVVDDRGVVDVDAHRAQLDRGDGRRAEGLDRVAGRTAVASDLSSIGDGGRRRRQ